jgi:hypothetical protein
MNWIYGFSALDRKNIQHTGKLQFPVVTQVSLYKLFCGTTSIPHKCHYLMKFAVEFKFRSFPNLKLTVYPVHLVQSQKSCVHLNWVDCKNRIIPMSITRFIWRMDLHSLSEYMSKYLNRVIHNYGHNISFLIKTINVLWPDAKEDWRPPQFSLIKLADCNEQTQCS